MFLEKEGKKDEADVCVDETDMTVSGVASWRM